MNLLFSIGLAIVVGGVLLFLIVAIRSYLSPKRRSAVGESSLATSALASGEYGRLGGFDTDTPDRESDGSSSDFAGGGTGGSYAETDAGGGSVDSTSSADE